MAPPSFSGTPAARYYVKNVTDIFSTWLDITHESVSSNAIKFIYSEKATKFCEIFPLLLTVCSAFKSKRKILQYCVAFSEYMNFNKRPEQNIAGHEPL